MATNRQTDRHTFLFYIYRFVLFLLATSYFPPSPLGGFAKDHISFLPRKSIKPFSSSVELEFHP